MLNNNSVGRPAIKDEEKDLIFRKLEPYLKSGLSINKACLKAQIPKSTIYDLCTNDSQFAEKLDTAKSYYSVLISSIIAKELERIAQNQTKEKLTGEELKFVQWVAVNSNNTKDEYGRTTNTDRESNKQQNDDILSKPNVPEALLEIEAILVQKAKKIMAERKQKVEQLFNIQPDNGNYELLTSKG